MRVIAGKLGGRSFSSPNSTRTHPMADKVRGALFNTLGDIEGLTVLDAFAGTGALGFEAVSRGAVSALLLENDQVAQRTIAENIATLDLKAQIRLVKAGCLSWSSNNPETQFDLVILDPPFDKLQPKMLTSLLRHVKQPDGLCIINWPGKRPLPELPGFRLLEHKLYGDTQLAFYR